jgi:hypothetical protein
MPFAGWSSSPTLPSWRAYGEAMTRSLAWPWPSKPGLGRLPGDIRIETESGGFYFPLMTLPSHLGRAVAASLVDWPLGNGS